MTKNKNVRTVRVKVYKFDGLSDQAKEKAIEWFATDYPDYDWWDATYDDAKRIGLKISGFDLDRASYVKGDLLEYAHIVAEKILVEHGAECETFKTATKYLADLRAIDEKYPVNEEGEISDNESEREEEIEELAEEFRKSLCEDYRIILTKELEWLTSREQIIESIRSNEYEFTADGKRF